MTTTVVDLVTRAKSHIENLSPAEVAAEQASGTLLVDLREPGEREQGTIAGSVPAPRGMLEFYADPASPYHREEFQPERRTILFCASGGRSALGATALRELGYTDVAHLDGGVKGWIAEGRPVEAGPTA